MKVIALHRGQPPDRVGLVGNERRKDHGEADGHDALDDEQPPPPLDAVLAVKLEDNDGKETSKGVADLRARVKYGGPQRHLLLFVKGGEKKDRAGEESSLGEAEKGTTDDETSKVVYGGGTLSLLLVNCHRSTTDDDEAHSRDEAPSSAHATDVDTWVLDL